MQKTKKQTKKNIYLEKYIYFLFSFIFHNKTHESIFNFNPNNLIINMMEITFYQWTSNMRWSLCSGHFQNLNMQIINSELLEMITHLPSY